MLCVDGLGNSEKTVESALALGNRGVSMAESSVFQYCSTVLPFKPFTGMSAVCLLLVLRGSS